MRHRRRPCHAEHTPGQALATDVHPHVTRAGVLGLPYAFAALGWAGGAIVLVGSLLISMYSFVLLVHLHEVRHHVRAPTRAGEGGAPWGREGRPPRRTPQHAVLRDMQPPAAWVCDSRCAHQVVGIAITLVHGGISAAVLGWLLSCAHLSYQGTPMVMSAMNDKHTTCCRCDAGGRQSALLPLP